MRTSAAAFWLTDLCSFSLSSLCTRVVLMLPAHVPINSTYKVKGLFNDSWDKNEDWAVLQSSRKRVFSDFREIVGNIFSLFPFPLVSCLAVFLLIVCPFIKFSPLLSLENTCHLLWTWLRSQKRGIFLLFLLSLSSFSSTSQWSFSVSEILLIAIFVSVKKVQSNKRCSIHLHCLPSKSLIFRLLTVSREDWTALNFKICCPLKKHYLECCFCFCFCFCWWWWWCSFCSLQKNIRRLSSGHHHITLYCFCSHQHFYNNKSQTLRFISRSDCGCVYLFF